jgi:hypothetical protein
MPPAPWSRFAPASSVARPLPVVGRSVSRYSLSAYFGLGRFLLLRSESGRRPYPFGTEAPHLVACGASFLRTEAIVTHVSGCPINSLLTSWSPREFGIEFGARTEMTWDEACFLVKKNYGLELNYAEGKFLSNIDERDLYRGCDSAMRTDIQRCE